MESDHPPPNEERPGQELPRAPFLSERQYRLHDFRRPRWLPEDRLRALEVIHRKFARNASTVLSALARARLQVDLATVAQRTYFDFIRSLPNPTALFLVYHLPQRTPFVLELSHTLLFPLVERLLGGKGEVSSIPTRPLTRVEQDLGRIVAGHVLRTLTESWASPPPAQDPGAPGAAPPEEGAVTTRLDLAEVEHNPLLMQIVGPSEPAVVLSFRAGFFGLPGAQQGHIHIGLPSRSFEPLLARLARAACPQGGAGERSSPEEREQILSRVEATPLEVTAQLARVPIALPDVLALRPGDVLDLETPTSSEIQVLVDGKTAFQGQLLSREGRRALRFTRAVGPEGRVPGPAPRTEGPGAS